MAYIYALIDPITHKIRYVGKTKNIKNRLKEHINYVNYQKSHKNDWIKSLLKKDLIPLIVVLEKCKDWQDSERFWIKLCRGIGCDLTNLTEGGEGVVGGLAEIGRKISEKNKGKIGPNKGKKFSDEWRKKLSESKLRHFSKPEARERMRIMSTGRIRSEEFKKKVSDGMKKANLTPWNKGIKISEQKPEMYKAVLEAAKRRRGKPKTGNILKGEKVYNAKLTMIIATEIREIWAKTDNKRGLARELAQRYKVHKDTIYNVVNYLTYKEINNVKTNY